MPVICVDALQPRLKVSLLQTDKLYYKEEEFFELIKTDPDFIWLGNLVGSNGFGYNNALQYIGEACDNVPENNEVYFFREEWEDNTFYFTKCLEAKGNLETADGYLYYVLEFDEGGGPDNLRRFCTAEEAEAFWNRMPDDAKELSFHNIPNV